MVHVVVEWPRTEIDDGGQFGSPQAADAATEMENKLKCQLL